MSTATPLLSTIRGAKRRVCIAMCSAPSTFCLVPCFPAYTAAVDTLSELGITVYLAMAALVVVVCTLALAIVRLSRSEGEDRDMARFLLTVAPAVLVGVIAMAYLVWQLLWIDDPGAPG